jgi:hypothetical protein
LNIDEIKMALPGLVWVIFSHPEGMM